jgi:hypothetical protein
METIGVSWIVRSIGGGLKPIHTYRYNGWAQKYAEMLEGKYQQCWSKNFHYAYIEANGVSLIVRSMRGALKPVSRHTGSMGGQ